MSAYSENSTLKQVAVIVPCFLLGCVGALALTAPNAAVQNVIRVPTNVATGVAATMAAATLANPGMALAIDTVDARQQRAGIMESYEARKGDLSQNVRAGMEQNRNLETAKARVAESAKRLESIGGSISKSYWVVGREELRRFVGTLRFDINTLAALSPGKSASILATKKDLFDAIDRMDFAMRSKDQASAAKYHQQVVSLVAKLA